MDKIYADPNVENDTTEHIRGKRLSSILKAPRNPLDDLGNGNELTQDINVEKRRKNSRRVSFANTIEVFQRDLKNNTAEGTGMNTLLHAPIRAAVPQTEGHDADYDVQGATRHDATLVFCDENEMDMTASHTAVITRNLHNSQADKTEKIDITSFLAGLNSNNGKAEMSKEFRFFSDPTSHSCPSAEQKEDTTAVKKIDFNEFLMSLKSKDKTPNPIEGPEKENIFCVPSQVSEDVAQSSADLVYSHKPPDSCNVTKVFGGQDDGMEMTKCQAPEVQDVTMAAIPGSISSETVFRGDKTGVFAKRDDVEITGNYTDVVCDRINADCQDSARQEKICSAKAVNKVVPTRADSERGFSIAEAASSGGESQNTRSVGSMCSWGAGEPPQANLAAPQKGSSQVPSFLEKSVVFPSGENMDLTGNCVVRVPDCTRAVLLERKAVPGYLVQDENKIMPLTGVTMTINSQEQPAFPADKTIMFAHDQDDMEVTASHTIAVNDNINGSKNQE
ncbi:Protein CASC5, partial [Buceros rhinoceros silvestris]